MKHEQTYVNFKIFILFIALDMCLCVFKKYFYIPYVIYVLTTK